MTRRNLFQWLFGLFAVLLAKPLSGLAQDSVGTDPRTALAEAAEMPDLDPWRDSFQYVQRDTTGWLPWPSAEETSTPTGLDVSTWRQDHEGRWDYLTDVNDWWLIGAPAFKRGVMRGED